MDRAAAVMNGHRASGGVALAVAVRQRKKATSGGRFETVGTARWRCATRHSGKLPGSRRDLLVVEDADAEDDDAEQTMKNSGAASANSTRV